VPGVCHIATAQPSLFGFSRPSPLTVSVVSCAAFALAGVGHIAASSDRAWSIVRREKSLLPARLFPFCAGVPAIGVGQSPDDEKPVAAVRMADFRRAEQPCRNDVAQASKLPVDLLKTEIEMGGHVFEHDEPGPGFPDDAGDFGPEVAGVVFAKPLAGKAERLARVSGGEHVEPSGGAAPSEGAQIIPDGDAGPVGGEDALGCGLDFDKAGGGSVEGEPDAALKATAAST